MKVKRQIIKIDELLCDGCGVCVSGCHEGALQIIDGKARLVSELYCDGLGACIGDCPVGAITLEEREVEAYNEISVLQTIIPKGEKTIQKHLKHLKDHGETLFLNQGIRYLQEQNSGIDLSLFTDEALDKNKIPKLACGCPGSMERTFVTPVSFGANPPKESTPSQLTHWPVQLHLLNPQAGFFRQADVVLAADCCAYAYADFHQRFIRKHAVAIACPKLDSNKESYINKLISMIDSANICSLSVIIMEVPCCEGLFLLAKRAVEQAERKIALKKIVIGVEGKLKEETFFNRE